VDEIGDRLAQIVAEHGPRSVAMYSGNGVLTHSAGFILGRRWWRAIESPMRLSSGSLDQSGKEIALSLHGRWGAGMSSIKEASGWMLIGVNPVVSMWAGMGMSNPVATIRAARPRGLQVIVADPRRTETAHMADIHLQLRPGSDVVLLAAMCKIAFDAGRVDAAFCKRNVSGMEALRRAVRPCGAAMVRRRCDVDPGEVARAMRALAAGRLTGITSGTGPNMSAGGTVSEYLVLALICAARAVAASRRGRRRRQRAERGGARDRETRSACAGVGLG
jgi:anaerobic selenocysteine-containing dehydrogenase